MNAARWLFPAALVTAITGAVLGTAVAAGTLTWFLLDGIVSIVTGALLNLLGNTVFLVLLMVPALALRSGRGGQRVSR